MHHRQRQSKVVQVEPLIGDNSLKIGYSEQTCNDLRLLWHCNSIRQITKLLNL